ncbi:hypothetical protein DAEQUDRAFT_513317 [Daedalea quercina L-15889]|uniref:Uncharacterized protein n=1 Tax=Daedalea quercina L-15889 TaxID=1314783 RepID=A0A165MHJ7_9APHY|nr:hypothetical protein DAEQUDRAFT_513317 [Daedalea quercina L-15889]
MSDGEEMHTSGTRTSASRMLLVRRRSSRAGPSYWWSILEFNEMVWRHRGVYRQTGTRNAFATMILISRSNSLTRHSLAPFHTSLVVCCRSHTFSFASPSPTLNRSPALPSRTHEKFPHKFGSLPNFPQLGTGCKRVSDNTGAFRGAPCIVRGQRGALVRPVLPPGQPISSTARSAPHESSLLSRRSGAHCVKPVFWNLVYIGGHDAG